MEKHKLTAEQARRIGLNPGDVVEVTLRAESEKPPECKNMRIAKDVYFNGVRVAGLLSLDG